MGRTNPTFRDLLRGVEGRWSDFRRALRYRDRPRFDRLFEYARSHADAASYLNHEEPLFPLLVAVFIEQERRLDEQAERVDEQAERLDAQAERIATLERRLAAGDAAPDGESDAV